MACGAYAITGKGDVAEGGREGTGLGAGGVNIRVDSESASRNVSRVQCVGSGIHPMRKLWSGVHVSIVGVDLSPPIHKQDVM